MKKALCLLLVGVCGCVNIPEGVVAVKGFDAQRYLGTWHEIARLDHSFEKDLVNVTANYSLKADGGLLVMNRGFNTKQNKWQAVEGRAYFVGAPDVGRLKVSFFGPFYGGYNIIALDEQSYAYALVCGSNRSYLWILARQPELPAAVMDTLTAKAKAMGFDTSALIYAQPKSTAGRQVQGNGR